VVEGHEHDTLTYQSFSQMNPNAIRQTICSINVRLGIPFHFDTRDHLERWILDRLIRFYNMKRNLK
jgi:hypothetical protein